MQYFNRLIEWCKQNKLTTVLVLVVAYFIWQNYFGGINAYKRGYIGSADMDGYSINSLSPQRAMIATDSATYGEGAFGAPLGGIAYESNEALIAPEFYPPIDPSPTTLTLPRKIITNSNMSILVKDVSDVTSKIETQAEDLGGYIVNKSVSTPLEGGSAYLSIRVPMDKRDSMVEFLRSVGMKVLNENVEAADITDQFQDLEAQLAQLNKTQAKFEEIYERAETVDEILRVQNQILSNQRQIDSVVGRINALDAKSKSTLISVSLTTDELALSYNPEAWRPGVTVKLAVRSLMVSLRSIGNFIIWLGVYAVIWIPVLAGVIWWRRRSRSKM